jgi:hypothetical protein
VWVLAIELSVFKHNFSEIGSVSVIKHKGGNFLLNWSRLREISNNISFNPVSQHDNHLGKMNINIQTNQANGA